jgi:polyisoprenoid-binding protein YceI
METATGKSVTTKWVLDPTNSEVLFKVRHMMISYVTGHIKNFSAEVESKGEDFTTAKVFFTAEMDSLTTNNEQRDNHLKSGEFFDIKMHPQMKFESSHIEKIDKYHFKMQGNLTIRGKMKPVVLNVEFGGSIKDHHGNARVGFTVDGTVNRKDFGMNFSATTETGGLVVSDEVKIICNVEFTKQL